jgi:hypothetical protein
MGLATNGIMELLASENMGGPKSSFEKQKTQSLLVTQSSKSDHDHGHDTTLNWGRACMRLEIPRG